MVFDGLQLTTIILVSFLYCYGAPSTQKSFSLSSIVVHGQFMKLLINTSNIPIFSLSTQHHQRHLLHPRHRRVVLYGHSSGNYSNGSLSSLHRLLQFHSLSNFIVFGKNESKSASLHSQKLEIFSIYQWRPVQRQWNCSSSTHMVVMITIFMFFNIWRMFELLKLQFEEVWGNTKPIEALLFLNLRLDSKVERCYRKYKTYQGFKEAG